MRASLVSSDMVKLPVPIGTPVYAIKNLSTKTVVLIEYGLEDITKEVFLSKEEAEKYGFEAVKYV